jgi:hypothetical protein
MLLKRGVLGLIVLLAAQPAWAGIDEAKLIDLGEDCQWLLVCLR